MRCRYVHPQLYQLVSAALFPGTPLEGPFAVQQAASGEHPLYFACFQDTTVTLGIAMVTFSWNRKVTGAKPLCGWGCNLSGGEPAG